MTPAEREARGFRAQSAWDEFFGPMIIELRSAYSDRIIEVANTELNPAVRADKLTALSNATKILNTLESGMLAIIRDGEMAHRDKLRADKIEQMTKPQRALLRMGSNW